ncbi:alpha/beta-hydrolase-like protein [Leptomonas pyrrhocoris]|uniref:nicotinamidase n=1 Tax=Leptomonas pyrrhocoris TaxID=157538 RepID=A0A0M9FPZ3_LEPPY|nr:alpha/beta-hydrolase-like protein [Leptomonas pyrrhocoris]XP_015652143.1 alpha/beta-hydrolase-like protein [Leptomonas pyrrhocoris]XP_015652144.1 alpha/beta-hydrolase-like protein [Leptomonas pyrrhocoris]XP_015652145.1 alpha/beta-hydrolase-like protein [Leptomonas pyrrhocoris]KPA73703.1 alpha/beta-hydrolase-like protein [Leptomonas pyrrhocoris]KPA73704.1 alpha/beta-hydrolase-like protein [Leptomonas pyrrhocoris]KPA73705.1 alpha/beta-hydrolase-like protein [Leptomonas pyrrhocoris]KPA73706.|eukprot:XP_015652142.1 alpha/beta-hydrolase-like protein [Leptomonas pyrrhocoris]
MASSASACAAINPATDALIIVDMQNDFLVDGAPLHVPGGLALVEAINAASRQLTFRCQVATQDWHTEDHCSFKEQGGLWPPHCVRGSPGADLHADLRTDHLHWILRKGTRQAADSYSAFADESKQPTGLAGLLHALGVTRVVVCGVAYDYCVFFTAMDARRGGFDVVVVADWCAAVDAAQVPARTAALREAGVRVVESSALSAE